MALLRKEVFPLCLLIGSSVSCGTQLSSAERESRSASFHAVDVPIQNVAAGNYACWLFYSWRDKICKREVWLIHASSFAGFYDESCSYTRFTFAHGEISFPLKGRRNKVVPTRKTSTDLGAMWFRTTSIKTFFLHWFSCIIAFQNASQQNRSRTWLQPSQNLARTNSEPKRVLCVFDVDVLCRLVQNFLSAASCRVLVRTFRTTNRPVSARGTQDPPRLTFQNQLMKTRTETIRRLNSNETFKHLLRPSTIGQQKPLDCIFLA